MNRAYIILLTSALLSGCGVHATGEEFVVEETSTPPAAMDADAGSTGGAQTGGDMRDAPDMPADAGAEEPDLIEEEDLDEEPGSCARDEDADGISDCEEQRLGTDPSSRDTDGDGLDDGDELFFRLDPTRADSRGDGIRDGERFIARACDAPAFTPIDVHRSEAGEWELVTSPSLVKERAKVTFASALLDRDALAFGDPAREIAMLAIATSKASAKTSALDVLAALGTISRDSTTSRVREPCDATSTITKASVQTMTAQSVGALRARILHELLGTEPSEVTGLSSDGGGAHTSFEVTMSIVSYDSLVHTLVGVVPAGATAATREEVSVAASDEHIEYLPKSRLRPRCSPFFSRDDSPDVHVIHLPITPLPSTMEVWVSAEDGVSGEEVPASDVNGYTFDRDANAIVLHGTFRAQAERAGSSQVAAHYHAFFYTLEAGRCP